MELSELLGMVATGLVVVALAVRLWTWLRRVGPPDVRMSPPRPRRRERRGDPGPSVLTPYVRQKLEEALPEDGASEALERLARASFPMVARNSSGEERVHLAIMKLVCDPWDSIYTEPSAMEKFDSALDLGRTDWRDLFVSSDLANEDWPEVLRAAGYEGPTRDPHS